MTGQLDNPASGNQAVGALSSTRSPKTTLGRKSTRTLYNHKLCVEHAQPTNRSWTSGFSPCAYKYGGRCSPTLEWEPGLSNSPHLGTTLTIRHNFIMSGISRMPKPQMRDLLEVVVVDDAVKESR